VSVDKDARVPGMVTTYQFSDELMEKIKRYQHGNAKDSRIAAVRQMLEEAYAAWELRINSRQS